MNIVDICYLRCRLAKESRHSTRHNPEQRKNSTMKTQRIVTVNPIKAKFEGDFRYSNTWADWLDDWEEADTPRKWNNLLFSGYDVGFERRRANEEPKYTPADRTKFYLSCADTSNSLGIPGESEGRVHAVRHEGKLVMLSHFRMRQHLAEKAMKMLCLYDFKSWADIPSMLYNWDESDQQAEYFTSADLLPTLMHFFGDASEGKFRHYNFRCVDKWTKLSHTDEITLKFVLKLIDTIFNWDEQLLRRGFYSRNEAEIQIFEEKISQTKVRFDIAKAWATEMLVCMGELDRLKEREKLEDIVLSTLRKIESRICVKTPNGERVVRGHQEALEIGSRTAWFLEQYFTTRGLNFDGTPIGKKKPARRVKRRRVAQRS